VLYLYYMTERGVNNNKTPNIIFFEFSVSTFIILTNTFQITSLSHIMKIIKTLFSLFSAMDCVCVQQY